jgi:hypothetical protein
VRHFLEAGDAVVLVDEEAIGPICAHQCLRHRSGFDRERGGFVVGQIQERRHVPKREDHEVSYLVLARHYDRQSVVGAPDFGSGRESASHQFAALAEFVVGEFDRHVRPEAVDAQRLALRRRASGSRRRRRRIV